MYTSVFLNDIDKVSVFLVTRIIFLITTYQIRGFYYQSVNKIIEEKNRKTHIPILRTYVIS